MGEDFWVDGRRDEEIKSFFTAQENEENEEDGDEEKNGGEGENIVVFFLRG